MISCIKDNVDLEINTAHNIVDPIDVNMRLLTLGVFTDLSNAFDTIDHDILLHIIPLCLPWNITYLRGSKITCLTESSLFFL